MGGMSARYAEIRQLIPEMAELMVFINDSNLFNNTGG